MQIIIISILLSMSSIESLNSTKPVDTIGLCQNVTVDSMGPCQDLVNNCRATANQEFSNGNYSETIWDMFYNSICPNAGLDCLFDVHHQ